MKKKISIIFIMLVAIFLIFALTNTVRAADPDDVAEINGTGYKSISSAVSAVQEGETIKLLKDVSYIYPTGSAKEFSVDLNGFGIVGTASMPSIYVTNNSKVTIKDTSKSASGYVKTQSTSFPTVFVTDGSLTIESGKVEAPTSSRMGNILFKWYRKQ